MILFYLLFYCISLFIPNEDESINIYIAKMDWHVGIILKVDDYVIQRIESIKHFENYDFVDIGWGDADFYQSPDEFDLYLATKAILFPTPSVVRIQGYNRTIDSIIKWRDYAFEVRLDKTQFGKLCEFINESFKKDSTGSPIISSEKYKSQVRFYSSVHNYHVMNTCNTWVAEAVETAGQNIESINITTAEELYEELLKIGKLLKAENNE